MNKNNFYLLMTFACLAGYIWLGWSLYSTKSQGTSAGEVCLVKHVVHIPCPSCGSTRSVIELLSGNIQQAFMLNPLGIFLLLFLLLTPVFIISDKLTNKDTCYRWYLNTENLLKKRQFAIPAIFLVVLNWIWNIYKGI